MGSGKMMVAFFSPAISVSVCRERSCSVGAVSRSLRQPERVGSRRAIPAFAWIIFARASPAPPGLFDHRTLRNKMSAHKPTRSALLCLIRAMLLLLSLCAPPDAGIVCHGTRGRTSAFLRLSLHEERGDPGSVFLHPQGLGAYGADLTMHVITVPETCTVPTQACWITREVIPLHLLPCPQIERGKQSLPITRVPEERPNHCNSLRTGNISTGAEHRVVA